MAKYLVCVSDERHASYEIERAILEKAGAELKLCHCESAADIAAQCADADAVLLDPGYTARTSEQERWTAKHRPTCSPSGQAA